MSTGWRHSLLPSPLQGALAAFLTGSSGKQVPLSMGVLLFCQRQPGTDSFEERTFLLVGSFDLIPLSNSDPFH